MRLLVPLVALAVVSLAALLAVTGPAVATEAEEPGDAATVEPTDGEEAPAGEEVDGEGEAGDEEDARKVELPLGFDDPYSLVGWGLLALVGIAGLFAARTMIKQLRGERSRADGSWRAR